MKGVQRIIIVIIAATVFLTGAGVTIINYCCTSCSGQTLFITTNHVCCNESQHSSEGESCCSSEKKINNKICEGLQIGDLSHCTASRLSIDIDASSYRPQILVPFVWLSDTTIYLLDNFTINNEPAINIFAQSKAPPEILPREYLSFIQVLII